MLYGHRLAVGQPKLVEVDDRIGRVDLERGRNPGVRGYDLRPEVLDRGGHPPAAHLLAERGEADLKVDLGPGDEHAPPMDPLEESFDDKRVHCLPDRHPGNAEFVTQLALAWQRIAGIEFLGGQGPQIVANSYVLESPPSHGPLSPLQVIELLPVGP